MYRAFTSTAVRLGGCDGPGRGGGNDVCKASVQFARRAPGHPPNTAYRSTEKTTEAGSLLSLR
jgi:hypothetical protein